MKIALVQNSVVPAQRYGGTERVIEWLARGLSELGHEIVMIAAAGSHNAYGELIVPKDFHRWESEVPASVDVLHLWSPPGPNIPKPFLSTIGGNGKPGERFHPNTVFVSKQHAAHHGSHHFVHNGLDPKDYTFSPDKKPEAVFLAKAAWNVKNLKGTIEVARAAKVPLTVMGSRNWPLNSQRLRPALGGVKYLGMVDDETKRAVLPRARALLFPVRWHEPFGIAVTEALVSGCCVLGTPYGSLPEIVTPEVGFLSTQAESLAQMLRKCIEDPKTFSPEACRARVINGGFTHLDMARSYIRYYERLLAQGNLGFSPEQAEPASGDPITQALSTELLPWN